MQLSVTPHRRSTARRARTAVCVISCAFIVLAAFTSVAFPPDSGARASLTAGALPLGILAVLMMLRLMRITRKADRFLGEQGQVLAFTDSEIRVSSDVSIPWSAVSGVWAQDRGSAFRERCAGRGLLSAIAQVLDHAGVNTIDLLIGIGDTTQITDPRGLVKRQRENRGRIELPFGAWHGPDELAAAMQAAVSAVASHPATGVASDPATAVASHPAPVRYTSGVLDYGAAWAGTQDDAQTIAEREAAHTSTP